MNILLSNDDGIFAEGLRALAEELRHFHKIVVVAPDSQRSGTSHACTYAEPVCVKKVQLPTMPDIPAFSTSGTPADCVRLGCTSLGFDVDLVVSGINHGANLGTHVLYSGTVGAAMEAVLGGKPAIAMSCYSWKPADFSAAARVALWAVSHVEQNPLPSGMLLNVNVPELPVAEIKGVRLTGLYRQAYEEKHVQFTDPLGHKTYFWMSPTDRPPIEDGTDIDERWVQNGYVTLTPIHYDITCYSYMSGMDVSDFHLR